MNHRNASCILDHNPRELFPIVDDKLRMRTFVGIGVATPEIYCSVNSHAELRKLPELLSGRSDFVIKPNHGSGGGVPSDNRQGRRLLSSPQRRTVATGAMCQYIADILSGMYSLGGRPDAALIQQRVRLHPSFTPIAFKGIPDIRVILYRGEPAMAMLRLPTRASNGAGNLHQGGIGTGIDLATGRTNRAVQRNRVVERHPDTEVPLVGRLVPYWPRVLVMARRVAEEVA